MISGEEKKMVTSLGVGFCKRLLKYRNHQKETKKNIFFASVPWFLFLLEIFSTLITLHCLLYFFSMNNDRLICKCNICWNNFKMKKMLKIVENFKNLQKNPSFSNYKKKNLKKNSAKKKNLLFNNRNTRFDQSSPVQPNPEKYNWEKSQKSRFKSKILKILFFCQRRKKCYSPSFANWGD